LETVVFIGDEDNDLRFQEITRTIKSNTQEKIMSRRTKTMPKNAAVATKKSKPLDCEIKLQRISVADVQVPSAWRTLDEKALDNLTTSMKMIGLQTPITVRTTDKGIRLIAGRHRLEAAKRLGWKRINAFVTPHNKIDRQLWREAENLDRAELTVLERAEAVARRASLVAERDAHHAHPGGRQPHDKGVSKAAKMIGTTRDDVRRSKLMAAILPEAKKAAVAAGLANNESALLKVAKEPTQLQVSKVHELPKHTGAPKLPPSVKEKKQLGRLNRAFKRAKEFKKEWGAAATIVRQKFIRTVLKPTAGRS
jgi:ParB family transcriptional regulator, chromosome partitioning protein